MLSWSECVNNMEICYIVSQKQQLIGVYMMCSSRILESAMLWNFITSERRRCLFSRFLIIVSQNRYWYIIYNIFDYDLKHNCLLNRIYRCFLGMKEFDDINNTMSQCFFSILPSATRSIIQSTVRLLFCYFVYYYHYLLMKF